MDWQTSEPPMDREIEVETDGGQTRRGQLQHSGQFGMAPGSSQPKMRNQFMLKGGDLEMFEVKRWREVPQD